MIVLRFFKPKVRPSFPILDIFDLAKKVFLVLQKVEKGVRFLKRSHSGYPPTETKEWRR